jgi:hypothetical protein
MILWVKFLVYNVSLGDAYVCLQGLSGRPDIGLLRSSLPNPLPYLATVTAHIVSSKYIVAELRGRSDTDCLL